MRKKIASIEGLTTFILICMIGFFVVQYVMYSINSGKQLKKSAISLLSYLHTSVTEDLFSEYSFFGSDRSLFSDPSPAIDLPIAGYAIVDQNGNVISATSPFLPFFSLASQLKEYPFAETYSLDQFLSAIYSKVPALTRFTCTPLGSDLYAYSDVIDGTDFTLILFHYSDLLDAQVSGSKDLATSFVITTIIIMIVLFAWMFFINIYSRLLTRRQFEKVNSIRRRYRIALSGNQSYIFEYSYKDDQMLWDETNSRSDILLDLSSAKRKEILHQNIVHPEDQDRFVDFCHSLISPEPTFYEELRIKTEDNEYEWYRINGSKIIEKEGIPTSAIGQMTNINGKKLEFLSILEQAQQDPLTKLLHYSSFSKKVNDRITHMNNPVILALLILDIDAFEQLNQSYGAAFADTVLIDLAVRLKKLCPENAILGRYASDEYVILLEDIPSMDYVVDMAQQILKLFAGIITDTKITQSLSGCIGTALYPVDANNYDELFEKAEIALYNAKLYGAGRYSIYEEFMPSLPDSVKNLKNQKLLQPTSSLFESRFPSNPIIAKIIEILFDITDINSSLSLILSAIGASYGLDRAFLRYHSPNGEETVITHEWNSDSRNSYAARGLLRVKNLSSLFDGYKTTQPNAFHCDDLSSSPYVTQIRNDICLADVKALFQFGILHQNDYIGTVNFCTIKEPHGWTAEEVESLTLIAKLISSYLAYMESQRKIDILSEFDPLTNVYNLNAFTRRADIIIKEKAQQHYAIVYTDISQFKLVNENYGYVAGDRILIALSDILRSIGGVDSIVCRISGDKFVALYPYDTIEALTNYVKSILMQSKLIEYQDGEYFKLILMIGIYPIQPGDSTVTAVDRANIARKNVENYHINSYKYYDESMHNTLIAQDRILSSMEDALKNREFIVYHQPKFDIITGKVIGSEALVRWVQSSGMVPPISFIPLFEKNGFIVQLDYYMLETVCKSIRERLDAGKTVLPVSVNFSRVHLTTNVMSQYIRSTLSLYNISPELIQIEVTESALSSAEDRQLDVLHEIKDFGCILSMDDFGSGMSSLNALRKLPFDELKIDRDFLYSNSTSEREQIVLSNVIHMANDLDMKVICEGVETKEQVEFLKNIGCRYAQGYLFARPVPEEDFYKNYVDQQ